MSVTFETEPTHVPLEHVDPAADVDPVAGPVAASTPMPTELERLEAEVARRKAARKAERTGKLGGLGRSARPRPATEVGEREDHVDPVVLQGLKARLAQLAAAAPSAPADADDEPSENPRAEHMARVFAASLAENDLSYLGRWHLDALAPDQHPGLMAGFVNQLVRPNPTRTLILAGRVGPGKTSAAIAAGHYATTRGHMVRIVRHADYLAALMPDGRAEKDRGGKDGYRDRYGKVEVLILDDLAAELLDARKDAEASSFIRRETLALINKRVEGGRATIVTTNQTDETIAAVLGDRLWSRLQDGARRLEFTHADRRSKLPPLSPP